MPPKRGKGSGAKGKVAAAKPEVTSVHVLPCLLARAGDIVTYFPLASALLLNLILTRPPVGPPWDSRAQRGSDLSHKP